MCSNNYFSEMAEIPSPKNSGLILRKWKLKNNKKDQLDKYESKFLTEYFNIGLAFYKYAPDIRLSELSERKRAWLQELSEKWKFCETNLPDGFIYKQLKSSNKISEVENQLKNFFQMGVKILCGKTTQPLIVGLGEPSPYETGITLDFLTGLPIIPGSALKGVTRRAAIMKLSGRTDILPYGNEFDELAKAYDQHEQIVEIFGTQDQKGKVIFMDAYPVEWPNGLFRVDIMNPHYGPYYSNPSEENPPADWYNPVPVPYLTVNTDVIYRFVLASEKENRDLLNAAVEWLKFALENIGVGAKGNQGYGVFQLKE
ncbi:MAG: type III-B CRISPR module RAMP protein Cmr6 [Candidatus Hydrothermota bacterium]|nr:MAG: type III-B CRISPR module RAMP protein Cmr6 [Candidatus Hydrothermae bacterium]